MPDALEPAGLELVNLGAEDRLEPISTEQCWELVGTQSIGRVAVVVGHYPLVFPVNFAVDRKAILYRTGMGTKIESLHRSNVVFEVDAIDPDRRTGWSVMIKGVAHELETDRHPDAVARADFGGATPWASGRRDHLIRIICDQITGRRIRDLES